jgi:hypothetical protein
MVANRWMLAWIALVVLPARVAIAGDDTDAALDRCERDTRDRLQFLESRLDSNGTYANGWWIGWTAVYSAGIAVEGARAGLTDDGGKRADAVVSAVKAGIGLTDNFVRPPPAKRGTRELRTISTSEPDGCARRLARAEEILHENAADSRKRRFSWKAHAANLGLNLAGALIVAKGFDESSGWTSGAVGLVVGEGRIWSYPWQPPGVLAEYERRFPKSGVPQPPETSWRLEPWGGGVRLVVNY